MRHRFCILYFLFSLSTVNAQTVSNLDKKYGINIFKLESDLKNYKNLEFLMDIDDGLKAYKYNSNKPLKIFGVEAASVHLCFFKDKLYSISYNFEPLYNNNILTIRSNLKELFGIESLGNTNTLLSYDWANVWETKKTYLHFAKYLRSNEIYSNCFEILMISNVLRNKMLNASF